jgi:hypothetical protein
MNWLRSTPSNPPPTSAQVEGEEAPESTPFSTHSHLEGACPRAASPYLTRFRSLLNKPPPRGLDGVGGSLLPAAVKDAPRGDESTLTPGSADCTAAVRLAARDVAKQTDIVLRVRLTCAAAQALPSLPVQAVMRECQASRGLTQEGRGRNGAERVRALSSSAGRDLDAHRALRNGDDTHHCDDHYGCERMQHWRRTMLTLRAAGPPLGGPERKLRSCDSMPAAARRSRKSSGSRGCSTAMLLMAGKCSIAHASHPQR